MPALIVDEDQSNDNLGDTTAQRDTTLPDETPPAPPAPPPAPTVPDKFRGKTVEELIASQVELEKVLGRQGQELGELRSSHDKYLMAGLEAAQQKPAPSNTQDESDDVEYFVNPKAAIDKLIANHPLIKEVQGRHQKTQQERASDAFKDKHPDSEDVLAEPEFRAWIDSSPSRLQRLRAANANYDFDTADDLFATYKEIKAAKAPAAPPPPAEKDTAAATAARAAALSAGKVPGGNASPSGAPTGKLFRRGDLMKLRNTDPERYEAMGPEILLAYKEKRVIN